MPKVLRVINRLNLGGPTYNVAYLTRFLAPEFETMLIAGIKDETEESSEHILQELNVKPIYIRNMHRSIHPWKDLDAYCQIKKIIQKFQPDIVHTHAAKAGALGRIAAIATKIPVIVHTFHGHIFHSYFPPLQTKIFLNIERYLAHRSSAIVAISTRQKQELAERYRVCSPGKIVVIPLGFDLRKFVEGQLEKRNKFRQRFRLADDEVVIGIVGRLVPVKNHRLFLEAFKHLLNHTSAKVRGLIVGDGEARESILQYAQQLGLAVNTENAPLVFTSWIKEIDEVMAGVDIVALTSLNEGTPVSIIEAQAAGKPVVATDVGGVADAMQEGVTGYLIQLASPSSFASYLQRLAEDEKLRVQMGIAGRRFVTAKFSYDRLVEDTKQLYYRLLASG